jgi:predicted Zn-dependent protease with MMP-like domain
MSSPNSTPHRRLSRTSNPTPPEREEKISRRDMLDQSNDDINSITAETLKTIIPHQFKISDQEIQKIQMQ